MNHKKTQKMIKNLQDEMDGMGFVLVGVGVVSILISSLAAWYAWEAWLCAISCKYK